MKRRTAKTGTMNGYDHAAAFDHAYQVFLTMAKKRAYNGKAHHKFGRRIRFAVDLEMGKGGTLDVEFSRTQGFRISGLGPVWDHQMELPEPNSIRHLPKRLQAYRSKLIDWQNRHMEGGLTFRHFNLLLAALSYGAVSNL